MPTTTHAGISFGQWIKNRRRALGWTQELLAEHVGCATETVRKIEADRRRPSQQLVELFAEALGISPAERQVFVFLARSEGQSPLPVPPPAASLTNVPAPATELIGRVADVQAISQQLRRPAVRLLTLLGTGGAGKTRLALQVAAEVAPQFEAVHWIELAPISDADLVLATLAQALHIPEVAGQPLVVTLITYLQPKAVLLVVDNFEQVHTAAHRLTELLAGCPQLKLLVTSWSALHVRGEHEYVVAPLALPSLAHLPPVEDLAAVAAVALFVARVQAIRPQWTLTSANAAAVAEICVRLDGLPLALELAAARVKVLGPAALLQRLSHRLAVLSGGASDLPLRQQSLRSTLQWSYELLSPHEQLVFVRLGVFIGGWTFEAAEAVCGRAASAAPGAVCGDQGGTVDLLDSMTALIDNSLVYQLPGDDVRFGMLETIREYAREQLTLSREHERLQEAQAAYFLALVEQAQIPLQGPAQISWLNRLEAEHDNIRAALSWSLAQPEPARAVRLASLLHPFWQHRGHLSEGRRWLQAVLALPDVRNAARVPPMLVVKALSAIGSIEQRLGAYGPARQYLEEALVLSRSWGSPGDLALELSNLANLAFAEEAYDQAVPLYQESMALFEELGDVRGKARCLNNLGYIRQLHGDVVQAHQLFEQALVIIRTLDDAMLVAWTIDRLGELAFMRGDTQQAESLYAESLALSRARGDRPGIAWTLVGLAQVIQQQGQQRAAAALLEESLLLAQEAWP